MLSKFITPGDKIDLCAVYKSSAAKADEKKRTYYSSVHDILSSDTLEITMPIEKNKLIVLPVECEYNLLFYGESGLYECTARITDRYKSDNVYILAMELTSNLKKYQRREYYRYSCSLDLVSRHLEEEEIWAVENKMPYALTQGLPLKKNVIVDISGGGMRFLSKHKYEPESLLYLGFYLPWGEVQKRYEVVGKVLSSRELEKREGTWEHRVEYYGMEKETREEIIRFIFEEERKSRRKEKFV